MSYSDNLETAIGRVRLDIQDNVEAEAHFTDEQLQVWLTRTSGDEIATAGLALRSWAASLSREDELVKAGSWQGERKSVVKHMLELSKQFLEESGYTGTNTITFLSANVDYTPEVTVERLMRDA